MTCPDPFNESQAELLYHMELIKLLSYCCEAYNFANQIKCQALLHFEVCRLTLRMHLFF